MIKNNYGKILIITLCIVFLIVSMLTEIIAENEIHIKHCDDTCCPICALICISTNFIRNIGIVDFSILIVIIANIIISLIVKNIEVLKKQTLVGLKIVQNN